jgi:ACT domain-containing protein
MFIEPAKNISNVSRIYLSKSEVYKYADIIKILNKNFSKNKYTLMQGELCRKELLVEIEGIANV